MNVFEDLIEELKEENLIEETVIETSRAEQLFAENEKQHQKTLPAEEKVVENLNPPAPKKSRKRPSQESKKTTNENISSETENDLTADSSKPVDEIQAAAPENDLTVAAAPKVLPRQEDDILSVEELSLIASQPLGESDFYRRRASEEVSSLKIVEHVISGVEREQMKVAPKVYNDISVSVALHDFLHISSDALSEEHSLAEFNLMQETETWYSALSHRDRFISAGDLRRFCESTRPALSSQALIALARFYRNSPFSDSIRSKFDMIVTRLVTKELKSEKREIVFERRELIEHFAELYADWSSIPVYGADDDPEVLIAVLKFEDFISEAKEANSFEELINKDFFNRLRIFKDGTGENFFSPLLTATAIECNVIVGNRYVELVKLERENDNADALEEKYNLQLDQTVSDVTSKTLQLIDLLKDRKEEIEEEPPIEEPAIEEAIPAVKTPAKAAKNISEEKESKFVSLKINKWLLIAAIIVLAVIGGLYIWVERFADPPVASPDVVKVSIEDSILKEYFKAARINEDTYYAVTQPTWKEVPKSVKTDILRKLLADGATKGYSKIHLLNSEGGTVGFASTEKGIELTGF